ncbi:MAG: ABC transporter permease [Candidatus Azobacteroides sp.]|nr:ABC transporter permease [Candidatus Azobacteroides sp.]
MFKNFISVFNRFKVAGTLNLIGLVVAFCAFLIITIRVNYEYDFDRCHPTADRVFRASFTEPEDFSVFSIILPRAFVHAIIGSSPHIEAGTIINPFVGDISFSLETDKGKEGFKERVVTCSPEITRVFGFPLIEGNADCLNDPEKIIIPQSMAKRLFGNKSAVGQSIHAEESIWTKGLEDFTVGAVYRDFPENTQLHNAIYTAINSEQINNWGASNFLCFVLLDNKNSAGLVADNFNRNFNYAQLGWNNKKIELVPLTNIYFRNELQDNTILITGSKTTTNILMFVGILIVIIAGINFVNFSIALAPMRVRSINTQKILGCSNTALRLSLLSEAFGISLLAYLCSLFIAWYLGESNFLSFFNTDMHLLHHLKPIGITGGIACLTGLLAGLYPAFYITSFAPVLALKGNFGNTPSGRRLRAVLIGFQFVITIGLIIVSLFMQLQNRYIRHYSYGYNRDQVVVVELNDKLYADHKEEYINRLKSFSEIEDVAFSTQKLGSRDGYTTNTLTYKGEQISYFYLPVSPNFFSMMGISVVEGEYPKQTNDESGKTLLFLPQRMKEQYGMELGEELFPNTLLTGFTDDVKFSSLRTGADNLIFLVNSSRQMPVSYIRLKAGSDYHAAIEHILQTIADIDPIFPVKLEFYNEIFDQLYHKEQTLSKMVTLFGILSVFVSIVGVFGLVVFETQYRRKEISIRKVHGATVGEILGMFNKLYIRIIIACFLIASPVAYIFVIRWLQDFAFKTPIYAWVFPAVLLIVLVITLAIVNFQSWRAATSNPVNSLKIE